MSESPGVDRDGRYVGLCLTCEHSRVVESARGSRFYLCRLAETDPAFRKYPALPVVECGGFRERGIGEGKR